MKTKILSFALLFLLIFSCNNDDYNENVDSKSFKNKNSDDRYLNYKKVQFNLFSGTNYSGNNFGVGVIGGGKYKVGSTRKVKFMFRDNPKAKSIKITNSNPFNYPVSIRLLKICSGGGMCGRYKDSVSKLSSEFSKWGINSVELEIKYEDTFILRKK